LTKTTSLYAVTGGIWRRKKLGYVTVPCELVNDLTDDEIRAYRLIDNRISEGEYDLSLELEELSNIEIDLG
jgi:hypothetical protein